MRLSIDYEFIIKLPRWVRYYLDIFLGHQLDESKNCLVDHGTRCYHLLLFAFDYVVGYEEAVSL